MNNSQALITAGAGTPPCPPRKRGGEEEEITAGAVRRASHAGASGREGVFGASGREGFFGAVFSGRERPFPRTRGQAPMLQTVIFPLQVGIGTQAWERTRGQAPMSQM